MKNKKLIIGCCLVILGIIAVFFISYASSRGAGTYIAKSYAGIYEQPYTESESVTLLATALPGEKLQVTNVRKDGWATVDYPEYGKTYVNFFALTPDEVTFPIDVKNFYDGNESILMLFQYLLWTIFLIAAVMLYFITRGNEKATFTTAALLVAAEISYVIIYFIFIAPTDIIIETAFNEPLSVVIAFLVNMIGIALLVFAHIRLIKLTYAEVKSSSQSIAIKLMAWILMAFIVLFTVYISLKLIVMAIVVAVVILVLVGMFAFVSFALGYERSHVTLTKGAGGVWSDGKSDYEVNEASGTARKKGFFEL